MPEQPVKIVSATLEGAEQLVGLGHLRQLQLLNEAGHGRTKQLADSTTSSCCLIELR